MGTSAGDSFRGFSGRDVIYGDSGVDRLSGEEGMDTLYGGGAVDRLFGGSGDDLFLALNGGLTVDDTYIGGAGFSGSGNSEARFAGRRILEVDQDGDGSADMSLRMTELSGVDMLTATDFVWR